MILEEVIYFHLGLGLLVATAVLDRFFLPVELAFFPRCVRGVFSIEGNGHFCMINQGILRTDIVLR